MSAESSIEIPLNGYKITKWLNKVTGYGSLPPYTYLDIGVLLSVPNIGLKGQSPALEETALPVAAQSVSCTVV